MKPVWIIPAAALTLGLAIGYGLRKGTASPTPRDATTSTANPNSRQTGRPSLIHASGPPASDSIAACQDRSRTDRIRALTQLYSTLDAEGFSVEAKRLADVPIDERFVGLFLLYGRWAETDPAAALDHLNAMGREGEPFLPVLLQSWANVDPAAAAAFYQANPQRFETLRGMGGGDAAAHIATEWARNDPEAALAWSRTLSGDSKDTAMGGVLHELAADDPAKAWDLSTVISTERRTEILTEIATAWGRGDFAGIERRIAAQSDMPDETKPGLRAAALIGYSERKPEAAAEKLASFPPGTERDDAVWKVVTENLAKHDAAAAARWVMDHSSDRDNHITRIMPEYVRQDAKTARAFAESLPPGRTRDWTILRYALDAIGQNKETSEQVSSLTQTIADPEVQGWARDWIHH